MRAPTELDLLVEEQAEDVEAESRVTKRKNVGRRRGPGKSDSARQRGKAPADKVSARDRFLGRIARAPNAKPRPQPARPAWMNDPSLLPKRPPSRST